jgi:hypothetical protein
MEVPSMSEFSFLLAVGSLVACTLAARLLIVRDHFDGLPPLPSEH